MNSYSGRTECPNGMFKTPLDWKVDRTQVRSHTWAYLLPIQQGFKQEGYSATYTGSI